MRSLCLALLCMAAMPPSPSAQTVGDVRFPNSGAAAAQAAFLYGLAQLHNFEYADAARAFRDAQQIDPGFAMAYWGEALTKNHPVWMEQDLPGARRVLERLAPTAAARRSKAPTDRERAYLDSIEGLFGPAGKHERDLAYRDAMRRIHETHPGDVDAAAFYGLALLGSVSEGRDTAVYMQAAAVLEEAFAAHPAHPGLAHYLIHAYDDPVHAPLGLRAAKTYSTIAASAPHALHMTSHIYLAAGMWPEVVSANEQAGRVGGERAARAGVKPAACGHVNMWLMYGYLQQARDADARRVLDGCRAQAAGTGGLALRAPEQDPLDPDNVPAGSYIQMWSRYVIDTADRSGEWTDALVQENIALGDLAGAQLTRAFVRALAAGKRKDRANAVDGLARVREARRTLEAVLGQRRAGVEQHRRRSAILEQEIVAVVAGLEGRHDEAVRTLQQAAADEEAMAIEFGPPFVDKPAAELLGELLLELKRPREAAAAYEAALRRAPNRAAARAGLARAREIS